MGYEGDPNWAYFYAGSSSSHPPLQGNILASSSGSLNPGSRGLAPGPSPGRPSEWWLDWLCVAFRLGGLGLIGISISSVVNPKVWVATDCFLVFHCDASGKGIGGFMAGLPTGHLWVFTPLPRGITLLWVRRKGARGAAVLDLDDFE